jgi:PEGA domain
MLVTCPCGKKLKVNDNLAGKKIRCPKCEEVFVAEEEAAEEEPAPPPKSKKKPAPEPEKDRANREPPPRVTKKTTAPAKQVEDDEDEEDGDSDETPSSPRQRGKAKKPAVPVWRTAVTAAVAVVLLGVMGVVLWRAFAKSGTVELSFSVTDAEVLIDGKKINVASNFAVTLSLSDGPHELTATKSGYQPFTKKFTVKSGETEMVNVVLKPEVVAVQVGPEELYRRMEQRILKSKNFQTQVDVVFGQDWKGNLKGTTAVAAGNKVRTDLTGAWLDGKPSDPYLMLSNGSKMQSLGSGEPQFGGPIPNNLGPLVLGMMTRGGTFLAFLDILQHDPRDAQKIDPEKLDPVSGFKFGQKETMGSVEVLAVEYQFTRWPSAGHPLSATVWINVKTNLPTKRVVTGGWGAEKIVVTETYTGTIVDGAVDEKQFMFPN